MKKTKAKYLYFLLLFLILLNFILEILLTPYGYGNNILPNKFPSGISLKRENGCSKLLENNIVAIISPGEEINKTKILDLQKYYIINKDIHVKYLNIKNETGQIKVKVLETYPQLIYELKMLDEFDEKKAFDISKDNRILDFTRSLHILLLILLLLTCGFIFIFFIIKLSNKVVNQMCGRSKNKIVNW